MALALPLLIHLFEPVQGMVHWLSGGAPAPTGSAAPRTREHSTGLTAASLNDTQRPPLGKPQASPRAWGGPTRAAPLQRPLRVVRVVDGRADCSAAGRMVISGRMADVCAELDRLAALETRH